VNVKLVLIGGLVGLIIAIGLTVLYFSLAKFFAANARALNRNDRAAEQMVRQPQTARPLQMKEATPEKREHKTAAKVGS
jgi:uncharacterized membrane protein YccC